MTSQTLTATPTGTYTEGAAAQPLNNVTIFPVKDQPSMVTFKGEKHHGCWTWDNASLVLKVMGLGGMTDAGAWSEEWKLEWE